VPLYTFFDISAFGRPDHAGYLEGYKTMLLGQFSDHLWFLWMLFDISVIYALLRKLINQNRLVILGIITLAIALVVSLFLQDFPYFKVSQIAPYLICYYTGVVFYKNNEKIAKLSATTCLIIAVILFVPVCMYVYFKPEHWGFVYVLKPVAAMFEFFLFRSFLASDGWDRFRQTGFYKYVSLVQMDFYLLHVPAPLLIFGILDPYIGRYPWPCVFVNFALTMFVTAIIVQLKRKLVEYLSIGWKKIFPAKG
jgi:hypothetical protein